MEIDILVQARATVPDGLDPSRLWAGGVLVIYTDDGKEVAQTTEFVADKIDVVAKDVPEESHFRVDR